jgi:hypothetical protein
MISADGVHLLAGTARARCIQRDLEVDLLAPAGLVER